MYGSKLLLYFYNPQRDLQWITQIYEYGLGIKQANPEAKQSIKFSRENSTLRKINLCLDHNLTSTQENHVSFQVPVKILGLLRKPYNNVTD